MVRSAAALTALLVLPGVALAQERPAEETEATHTVERGESLWNLARDYFDDPFQWRRIFEANSEDISDPHWIYPGQHFAIPGAEGAQPPGAVTDVQVSGTPTDGQGADAARADGAEPTRETVPAGRGGFYPGPGDRTVFSEPPREDVPGPDERTAFYGSLQGGVQQEGGEVLAADRVEYFAVSSDIFHSAAWLARDGSEEGARFPGRVVGWAGTQGEEGRRETVVRFDRIEIEWSGELPPERGDRLHLARTARSDETLGDVVRPTALARVVERGEDRVVAVVERAFQRPQVGDRVARAPEFPLERGEYARPVDGDDRTAVIAGFARPRPIQQIGDVVFLDVGRDQGVRVGDVFAVEVGDERGFASEVAATVEVVRVFDDRASARVASVTTPVFRSGLELRRIRRMP